MNAVHVIFVFVHHLVGLCLLLRKLRYVDASEQETERFNKFVDLKVELGHKLVVVVVGGKFLEIWHKHFYEFDKLRTDIADLAVKAKLDRLK